jgi:uncharacterized ubiquitin-like protein YukD
MAGDIRVKVTTIGGDERDVETPLNLTAREFIKELVMALKMPFQDREGNEIHWRIDNKDTAATLDCEKTLSENGVREGHHLNLIRATVACASLTRTAKDCLLIRIRPLRGETIWRAK